MGLRKIIIAIDGYSACGKSTTAKETARILGFRYIDTGAMYRAVTLHFIRNHVAITNPHEVDRALKSVRIAFHINSKNETETFLDGLNVEEEIRTPGVSDQVSEVSAIGSVRSAMVEQQRKMGREKGVVLDGRDIGTVVFPDAELKLFMSADIRIRAIRRQQEWLEKGNMVNLSEVMKNLRKRDRIDATRKESPLRKAPDAIELDTSYITIDEQVDEVVRMALGKMVNGYTK